MKKLIIFCLLIIVVIVFGDTKNETNKKSLGDTINNVASVLGSPELAASVELLKSIRSESSSTMSERHDRTGFIRMNHVYDYSNGAIYKNQLDKLVSIWLNDDIFNFLSPKHKTLLTNAIEEYALQYDGEKYNKQKFELSFNNGKGNLFIIMLSLTPHMTNTDIIHWGKYILSTEFEPAPPYVVVTHSDCNILSCDRYDEIVYLPAVITDVHINSVINLNIGLIDTWQQNLLPNK